MKIRRTSAIFLRAFWLCVVLVWIYVVSFACRFDVLSDYAVRNNHGWLGPVILGDKHTVDIGKVVYYEGTDVSLYQTYRPLCVLWLRVWGFSD